MYKAGIGQYKLISACVLGQDSNGVRACVFSRNYSCVVVAAVVRGEVAAVVKVVDPVVAMFVGWSRSYSLSYSRNPTVRVIVLCRSRGILCALSCMIVAV